MKSPGKWIANVSERRSRRMVRHITVGVDFILAMMRAGDRVTSLTMNGVDTRKKRESGLWLVVICIPSRYEFSDTCSHG